MEVKDVCLQTIHQEFQKSVSEQSTEEGEEEEEEEGRRKKEAGQRKELRKNMRCSRRMKRRCNGRDRFNSAVTSHFHTLICNMIRMCPP